MASTVSTAVTHWGAVGGPAWEGGGGAHLAGRGTQRGDVSLLVSPSLCRPGVQPVRAESSPEQGRPGVCGLGPGERLFTRCDAGQTGAAWGEGLGYIGGARLMASRHWQC